jgi:hypothetical protein
VHEGANNLRIKSEPLEKVALKSYRIAVFAVFAVFDALA